MMQNLWWFRWTGAFMRTRTKIYKQKDEYGCIQEKKIDTCYEAEEQLKSQNCWKLSSSGGEFLNKDYRVLRKITEYSYHSYYGYLLEVLKYKFYKLIEESTGEK